MWFYPKIQKLSKFHIHKNTSMFLILLIMGVILTGCNQQSVNITHDTSVAESEYSSSETSSLFTENIIDIDNKLEHNSTEMPIAEIDINFDGICEDFFVENSGYRIVMYNDEKKTESYYEVKIPRIENIDIYRYNTAQSDGMIDYSYCFSYTYGTEEKNCIIFSLVYTGGNGYKTLHPWYYYKTLSPYVEYEVLSKSEFDALIFDSHNYLEKQYDIEYITTICLENYSNCNCIQSYVDDMTINSKIPAIEIYSLKNDAFGKSYKLTNSKYSYFSNEFDMIEVYERYASVKVPTNVYNEFNIEISNEKEYLIRLINSENEDDELLYLGTTSENFLFPYNYLSDNGNDQLIKDGWNCIEQFKM